MANLRTIKKDVDFLISTVISDCYTCIMIGNKPTEEVIAIVKDAIDARDEFRNRINHPVDKKNKSLVKKHYKFLQVELVEKTEELFLKLSEVCR